MHNENVTPITDSTGYVSKIHEKLYLITRAVEQIEKKGYNEHHGYSYVRAVDVVREIKKLLLQHGIKFSVEDIDVIREQIGSNVHTKIKSKATYACARNPKDKHEVIYFSASADSLDKDIFKAKTNGLKYHFIQEFLIDSDDCLQDTESEHPTLGNYVEKQFNHPNPQINQDHKMVHDYNQKHRQPTYAGQKNQGKPKRASYKQCEYIMQMQNKIGYNSDNLQWEQVQRMSKQEASMQIERYMGMMKQMGVE